MPSSNVLPTARLCSRIPQVDGNQEPRPLGAAPELLFRACRCAESSAGPGSHPFSRQQEHLFLYLAQKPERNSSHTMESYLPGPLCPVKAQRLKTSPASEPATGTRKGSHSPQAAKGPQVCSTYFVRSHKFFKVFVKKDFERLTLYCYQGTTFLLYLKIKEKDSILKTLIFTEITV